jgi:hypothetical protein
MNALHSLYDALISINVPADKARAVVDAMERDMSTLLASKSDVAMLRQEMETTRSLFSKELQLLKSSMEVRLGSMLVVALGVLFAALKLT